MWTMLYLNVIFLIVEIMVGSLSSLDLAVTGESGSGGRKRGDEV